MKKVILFGGTGHLGKKLATELTAQGYQVTAIVRTEAKAKEMAGLVQQSLVTDLADAGKLADVLNGNHIVVSALGKSVSPFERSKPSFREVDLDLNTKILEAASGRGIEKFVYVSALHAERYPHLEYFRVHHEFSEKLKRSGIDFSILKPPALFSAFLDMIAMAQKGFLFTMGKGDKLTNPIDEKDLARIAVNAIPQSKAVIEAGGKEVLSRHQINETVQRIVYPKKDVRKIPLGVIKTGLPLVKMVNRNLYDKMAFFLEVLQHDTLAPQLGDNRLEDYLKEKIARWKQSVSPA